ncbi:hypothetical protein B0O80DRAFT_49487 [Mortierella sp. GBAus27b]|nr:hypothetical protein B0O80DRAFT_49487 [Mortierella sp. GBAus27b]
MSPMSTSIPRAHTSKHSSLLLLLLLCSFLPSVLSISAAPPTSPVAVFPVQKRQIGSDTQPEVPPNYNYLCTVIGECLACSALQVKTEESCRETHNRQRIECRYEDPKDEANEELKIRLPKYRSCLHVKAVEARRFAHFFSTNIILALFSGTLLIWRQRKLAAAQYRRMARRIGIA